jgi:hypothetical protein
MATTQKVKPIRPVTIGALHLKGEKGAVNVFSGRNRSGVQYEIDAGSYPKMDLEGLNIMSMTVPPMTRVTIFTSNSLLPSSTGQLTISNTKNSILVVSDLGMDVNSIQITQMNINQIINKSEADKVIAGVLAQNQGQVQTTTQVETFDNTRSDPVNPVYYTSTEMSLCLICLVLILYIVYSYNRSAKRL